jgi:hypothetical protein
MGSLFATMLLQGSDNAGGGVIAALGFGFMIIWLAVVVLMIASLWVVFTKAGQPGWAVLIPIYNIIVLLNVAKKPLWWIILFLIPVVNFIMAILVAIAIATNFGKGTGFGIGLAFLPPIFYPMLAWGDARYQG